MKTISERFSQINTLPPMSPPRFHPYRNQTPPSFEYSQYSRSPSYSPYFSPSPRYSPHPSEFPHRPIFERRNFYEEPCKCGECAYYNSPSRGFSTESYYSDEEQPFYSPEPQQGQYCQCEECMDNNYDIDHNIKSPSYSPYQSPCRSPVYTPPSSPFPQHEEYDYSSMSPKQSSDDAPETVMYHVKEEKIEPEPKIYNLRPRNRPQTSPDTSSELLYDDCDSEYDDDEYIAMNPEKCSPKDE